MGLMDKVKAQATQLAQKTQETARDGMAKFDQAQGKRQGDAMLRNLGALVYADRTGRGSPDTQQQVDQLIADISTFESENGINLAAQPADQQAADSPGTAPADPAGAPASRYPSAPSGPAADFGSAPPSRYPAATSPPAADFGAPPAAASPAAPPPAADFGAPPAGSPAPPPPAADFGAPPAGSPAPPPPPADFGAPPAAAYPSAPEPPEAGSEQS
jgi:hypothetical protein